MGKVTQRLSREDWILAGFRALAAGGAGALRVEPVSRDLGATKGSFYWHFVDPADWRAAMLTYWEEAAFRGIVDGLQAVPAGRARLQALAQIAATRGHDPSHGGTAAEPALRDWARYAPDVAEAVRRVDAGRVAFVAECLRDTHGDGRDCAVQARLFYATYLGLQALQGVPEDDVAALLGLISLIANEA
jgi:AcrR family transcriptional regulator